MAEQGKETAALGFTTEVVDDRIQCLALEYGLSREELVAWALGIGLTVMEVKTKNPDARIWAFDGERGEHITTPGLGS